MIRRGPGRPQRRGRHRTLHLVKREDVPECCSKDDSKDCEVDVAGCEHVKKPRIMPIRTVAAVYDGRKPALTERRYSLIQVICRPDFLISSSSSLHPPWLFQPF